MKRILSLLIAVLLLVSVFVGCDNTGAECKHNWEFISQSEYEYKCSDCNETHLCVNPEDWERAGNLNESTAIYKCKICGSEHLTTDPDSLSGNRLLFAMTIAETRPSCVVFEYKDEKPYCFYAYDSEGKLYRVFWNDFTGLSENDIIAVEHEDDIKTLSYDEYPDGGWTPQYEITAINVSVNSNETPKYRYSSTVVSSGKNNIRPIECFEGTTYYENGQPSESGCGAGEVAIFDNPETKISDFPVLIYDGNISISVSVNVTLGLIDVYDTSFQKLDYKINEISELASLPYGEYLVTFAEQIDSRGCDAEIENYYIIDNTSLFRFVIQEPSSEDLEDSGYQAAIRMMRFNWDGYGISTKWIETCDLAYSIIDAVEELTETGETVEKISDAVVDENATELPIERGTLWFQVGSKIYRIDPDFTQICRVEGHLGKGYVMNASEQLKKMISDAWQYHPYDYYTGSYNNETDEIEINHVYDAPSTVHVHIKKVEVINDDDPANKITLELTSTVDQTISVRLNCSQSDDNLAEGDFKDVTLKAGQAETVELSFGGWKEFNYWIDISVDNTRINLRIEP